MDQADLKTKPWHIHLAQPLFAQMSEVMQHCPFILTMTGSVVRHGVGNDLDLIAVQWKPTDMSLDGRLDCLTSLIFRGVPGMMVQRIERVDAKRASVKYHYTNPRPMPKPYYASTRIVDLLVTML